MAAGIPAKSYHVLLSAKMSTDMKEGGSLFPQVIKGVAKPTGTARFYIVIDYRGRHRKGIRIYKAEEVNLQKNFN